MQLLADFSSQKKHNARGVSEHVEANLIQIYSSWNKYIWGPLGVSGCGFFPFSLDCLLSSFQYPRLRTTGLDKAEMVSSVAIHFMSPFDRWVHIFFFGGGGLYLVVIKPSSTEK